jgi:homoserine dehydrogenase
VLTQLELGRSFEDAVHEAQARGLAEADISRDLDGRDPAAKLAIVAWISFGIAPSAFPVRRIPLPNNPTFLVKNASDVGCRVRLIAECVTLSDRQVCASVEPTLVSAESAFARTQLEDNRIEVELGWAAPLSVSGPGAGGRPTATSLLNDILSKSNGISHGGPARAAFTAVADPRVHRWLLVSEATTERSIISATWKDLERSLALREYRGIPASVARIDDSVSKEFVQ